MTGHATLDGGHEAWVGSGRPNTTHNNVPRLKVTHLSAYTFVRRHCPVPYGDSCTEGKLRLWIAEDATGTFTFTARRTADAVHWGHLTWNNMPGVKGGSMPTVTVTDPRKGDMVEFDVATHLNTIASSYGQSKHYGWRIESDNDTPLHFYGDDSANPPELYAEWTRKPATPTDLAPSGTISVAKPVLTASADDTTAEEDVSKVRWEIDAASDGTAPDFDSGLVAAEALELDLATTAFAGLTEGATTYQRCMWVNGSGAESDWSDWYPITRKAKPTIAVSNPSGGAVTDLTPILLATASGAITHWRIRVVDPTDPSRVLATSRKKKATGTTFSWEVPKNVLVDGETYRAQFDVWDDEDRVVAPGDKRFAREVVDFTVNDVAGVEVPVLVSVTQVPDYPAVDIKVTTTAVPDTFTFRRDGEVTDVKVDAVDIFDAATNSYIFRQAAADPLSSHDFQVRSVFDGQQSRWSNTVTATVEPAGLWLLHVGKGLSVKLSGDDIEDWQAEDQVGFFDVQGRSQKVMIRSALGDLGGGFSGLLLPTDTRSLKSFRSDLRALRKLDEPVRLIAADYSQNVRLYNVTDAPHKLTFKGDRKRRVSFQFIESDSS